MSMLCFRGRQFVWSLISIGTRQWAFKVVRSLRCSSHSKFVFHRVMCRSDLIVDHKSSRYFEMIRQSVRWVRRERMKCLRRNANEGWVSIGDVFSHHWSISIRLCNCSYSRCNDLRVAKKTASANWNGCSEDRYPDRFLAFDHDRLWRRSNCQAVERRLSKVQGKLTMWVNHRI